MQLHRTYKNLPDAARGCVLALGNFDGLHLGHRAVLAEAKKQAEALNAPLAVMSFEPHPRRLFNPDLPPLRLFPVAEKLRLLKSANVDHAFLLSFTREFSKLPAEEFIQTVLIDGLNIKHLVTGNDFQFGYKRGGNAEMLKAAPFGYSPIKPFLIEGEPCSSTRIRQGLRDGSPDKVRGLLGRDYEMISRVLHGEKRGREWGFPTANIAPPSLFSPAYGVYAVTLTRADGGQHHGVANYGIRPMYPLTRPLMEVHLFDVSPDLYGERVKVALNHYLRPEENFASEQELIEQIKRDAQNARDYFEESKSA